MKKWIRRYWSELLVFGAILGVLLITVAPDMTWVNTDSDGIHYTYAAKYLLPAHKTSAPLFLLLGHLFLKLPFGTEFWRFAMLSVLATTASSILVYLIIKETLLKKLTIKYNSERYAHLAKEGFLEQYQGYKAHKLYALIGALVFGGSALVISQSTIVESYALVTMLGLGAYYFASKGNWLGCAIMLGAGGAVHHLIGTTLIVLFVAHKELRQWKYIGIMSAFLLFYLYLPITVAINKPLNMWGNQTLMSFLVDNASTAQMLIGALGIWELPKRIFDAAGILGISFGLAIIPIGWTIFRKGQKQVWYKRPLLWLFVLPVIYYASDLAPQTYVYAMPAIGFGAVMVGVSLSEMRPYWKYVVLGCAVGLLVFNANYFDIGRTLDPELSASKYYHEELSKVPDGGILIAQQGWEWAAVTPYNRNENRNIVSVCQDVLPSPIYQEQLRQWGVKFTYNVNDPRGVATEDSTKSIIQLNDNVWITETTTPETYGAKIIQANGNTELVRILPKNINTTEWKWRPSSPYGIITGSIEIREWVNIVVSNYNVLTFVMLGAIGLVPCWIGHMALVRKKKWSLKRQS